MRVFLHYFDYIVNLLNKRPQLALCGNLSLTQPRHLVLIYEFIRLDNVKSSQEDNLLILTHSVTIYFNGGWVSLLKGWSPLLSVSSSESRYRYGSNVDALGSPRKIPLHSEGGFSLRIIIYATLIPTRTLLARFSQRCGCANFFIIQNIT